MKILGIESSCDDTAAAVVDNGRRVLSAVVATQFEFHRKYSGVVPELASRAHVLFINQVIEKALKKARVKMSQIEGIAVTLGPGLAGSLLVGKMTAETLGWVYGKPVVGVNHIEGHLLSPVLADKKLKPPFLGLVVSGGHTELIVVKSWSNYSLLGRTRDDAAGEAFDKVAKMLHLGYPGGPVIDRLARGKDPKRMPFPRPWLPGVWDFSFSGLKTAVLYKIREKKNWSLSQKKYLCAGFQQAVVDVLVGKAVQAAKALKMNKIVVGGGVAANSELRRQMDQACRQNNLQLFMVPKHLCTDNAAMIASSGYFKVHRKGWPRRRAMSIDTQLSIAPFSGKRGHFDPRKVGV